MCPQIKKRLDQRVVEEGLAPSRTKAQAYIMAGQISVNGVKATKPGTPVEINATITMQGIKSPYVSRGGLKLEHALKEFNINPDGKTALDCGASTGGFTDCLLKHGAIKIYAIDVGYGQIIQELRQDNRVVVIERCNIRYLNRSIIKDTIDLITLDLSFISLEKVWPALIPLTQEDTQIIALVKPQFEAGHKEVKRGGKVTNMEVHKKVLETVINKAQKYGLYTNNITYSPIPGPAGNIEFFILLSLKPTSSFDNINATISLVVVTAHNTLNKSK